MLGNIVATFLNQPIHNDFCILRQPAQASQQQPDAAGMQPSEAIHQLAKGGSQTQLLQNGRAQGRDQAPHLKDGSLGEIASLFQFADPLGMFRRQSLFQKFHLQPDAEQGLSGFIVQLSTDPAAFHLLDVQHMLGQLPDLLFAGGQVFHQASLFGGH
jgi:hypothetical protein